MAISHPTTPIERVWHPMSEIDDLKAELARLENEKTTPIEGTVVDGEGGLFVTVRDESFEIRRVSVSYPMMKFAQARRKAEVHIPAGWAKDDPRRKKLEEKRNEAGMEIMALLLDAMQILLKPKERDRFDSYLTELSMSDEGLKPGELEEVIGHAMSLVGDAEDKGKAADSSSSSSSNGSHETSENVRVISSTRVTPMDGLPADLASKRDATFSTQSQ